MWVDDLRQDVRYALRTLARSPLFALTAIVSIAIGIAADTTVFSVANALLLHSPAGVRDPHVLVAISGREDDGFGVNQISFPNFSDLRERATTLSDVFGYEPAAQATSFSIAGGAERVFAHRVTPNYFAALGVGARVGRVLDGSALDADAVVLSDGFWARRFARDPAIVGATVVLNNRRATIVGVASEQFSGTSLVATDVWAPLETVPFDGSFLTRRELGWALVGARLRPGVSIVQARAEVDAIATALGREYPESNAGRGFQLAALSLIPGNLSLPLAGVLTLLLAFVSLVLIIACANLAGLLLTRAVQRRREIAVRVALGSGRARLVRQLLTEVLLLFAAGSTGGVLLAYTFTRGIDRLLPLLPVSLAVSVALDARVMAFAMGLALVSGLAAGLVPALQASRTDVVSALKDDSPAASRRARLRNASVLGQVAASVVLVAATAVFVRALERMTSMHPGFDPRGVELASIDLSLAGYTPATGAAFLRDLAQRLRVLPAVEAATIAAVLPTGGATRFGTLTHPGTQPGIGASVLPAEWNVVEPGYFETLRIPIVRGRDFTAADTATSERVIIVSEEAARGFWPDEVRSGQDVIGRFLLKYPGVLRRGVAGEPVVLRLVGVVGSVNALSRGTPRAHVYLPLQQQYTAAVTIAARASDGRRLFRELREVVAGMDAKIPVLSSETLDEAVSFAFVLPRIAASISIGLGLVALLLAAIGIHGLVGYTVADRTREIGVRVALGAQRHAIVRLVVGGAVRLTLSGCAFGLTIGGLAHVALTRTLFGFPGLDPLAFAAAMVVFVSVAVAASYVPVRRALAVDPVPSLRIE